LSKLAVDFSIVFYYEAKFKISTLNSFVFLLRIIIESSFDDISFSKSDF